MSLDYRIAVHWFNEDPNLQLQEQTTLGERVADRVARLGGSWTFIGLFILFLLAIGGVRAVACTGSDLFTAGTFGPVDLKGGATVTASIVRVDSASFDVYRIRPRAGDLSLAVPVTACLEAVSGSNCDP